jgi:probable HAF family extracellular repeat protein
MRLVRARFEVVALSFDGVLYAANDDRVCVGQTEVNGTMRAVAVTRTRQTELGTLGGSASSARGINNSGAVVGGPLTEGDTAHHGFLWEDGVMVDLNTLVEPGWEVVHALAINDRGDIVALANWKERDELVLLRRQC